MQQAELAKLQSIREQIDEKQAQLDQLRLVAPFDGVVFSRELEQRQGAFVSQGDVLMHFADPAQKEILVSIDQQEIEAVKARMDRPVRILFTGVAKVTTHLESIEPRASDLPADPSMTAAAGGPLPVRPASSSDQEAGSDDDFRLISPRFTGKCEVAAETADSLVSGQRGTAFLNGRNVSLGGYAVIRCREWIRQQLKAATQGSL